jgi:protein-S-isoprenylcysteine O-methyltransferase Ste14
MVSKLYVLLQTSLLAALGLALFTGWGQGALRGGWIVAAPGVTLCAAAAALALPALIALGSSLHIAPAPRPGARFVGRGIYRRLRHPMYTSAVALAAGVSLIVPTLPVIGAAMALIVFYLVKSRYEERLLLAHYPEYGEYMTRTRGVFLIRGLP